MTPTLGALLADLEKALAGVSPEDAPRLLGELRRLEATMEATMIRALVNGRPGDPPVAREEDRWLTPEEAAKFLGLTMAQLSRRRGLPRRKLGHRTVRYSLAALKRYLARGT